jgi:hypothetical protein
MSVDFGKDLLRMLYFFEALFEIEDYSEFS